MSGQNAALDMPRVFGAAIPFDSLSAQVAWTRASEHTEVRLTNVSFSNADVAGNLSGVYTTARQGPGEVDFDRRADARRGAQRPEIHPDRDACAARGRGSSARS